MTAIQLLAVALATALAAPAFAQSPKLLTEEMLVPSEPGIEIYVRNKRPADMTAFRPERTLLFVHGATYPAHAAFDLKLDGLSWMEYIAARGYDVYLLDLRGYGKSTRPKEMDESPEANAPCWISRLNSRPSRGKSKRRTARRCAASVSAIATSGTSPRSPPSTT